MSSMLIWDAWRVDKTERSQCNSRNSEQLGLWGWLRFNWRWSLAAKSLGKLLNCPVSCPVTRFEEGLFPGSLRAKRWQHWKFQILTASLISSVYQMLHHSWSLFSVTVQSSAERATAPARRWGTGPTKQKSCHDATAASTRDKSLDVRAIPGNQQDMMWYDVAKWFCMVLYIRFCFEDFPKCQEKHPVHTRSRELKWWTTNGSVDLSLQLCQWFCWAQRLRGRRNC